MKQDFSAWLVEHGIRCSGSSDSSDLAFVRSDEERAFWLIGHDPDHMARVAAALIDSIEPWRGVFLWPRDGSWPGPPSDATWTLSIRDKIMRCVVSNEGWRGALYCSRRERSAVISLMFCHMFDVVFPQDDLYLVSESGQEIIYIDSENAIHVECASSARLDAVVASMAERGIDLPDEVPVIFKWPKSMARQYRKRGMTRA